MILTQRNFENYDIMHKHLNLVYGELAKEHKFMYSQLTTDTAVEVQNPAGETIAQIGKTEVTLQLTCATADEATHNNKVFTLVYKNAAGVVKTCTATGTATLFNTPVNFTPACNDFYCALSFTASADFDTRDIYAKVAAGAVYATISAAGTVLTATDAQLKGVGSITIKQKTDQVATDGGSEITLDYLTPWGELKSATALLSAVDT